MRKSKKSQGQNVENEIISIEKNEVRSAEIKLAPYALLTLVMDCTFFVTQCSSVFLTANTQYFR